MRRLFIDPSINHCGWALFDAGDLRHFGTFNARPGSLVDRLEQIKQHFGKLAHDMAVEETVIEELSEWTREGKNVGPLLKEAMAIGVLIGVTPPAVLVQWKKKESKQDTQRKVELLYKRFLDGQRTSEHCRDAIGMAHYWLSELKARGGIL